MESRPNQRENRRGLMAYCGDFLRWLFFLLLLTAGVALAVLYLIQTRLDEEIRAHIEAKFQDHYSELVVTLRSARRLADQGIELRGLSIMDPSDPTSPLQLAFVDELLIRCDSSLTDLMRGSSNARQVVIRRLKLQATRQTDGSWNVERLWPLPKFGDRAPPARIESGAIEMLDRSRAVARSWKFHGINLDVVPSDRSVATPAGAVPLRVTGTLAGRHFKRLELDGQLDPASLQWSFLGTIEGLQISGETTALLPSDLPPRADLLRSLRGQAQLGFRVSSSTTPGGPLPFHFAVRGTFRGRLEDPALPRPLRDIETTFQCNTRSLVIESFRARAGPTKLVASGSLADWRIDDSCRLQLSAEYLVLDDSLKAALPADWQKVWNNFEPQGVVDANVTLQSDGQQWSQDLRVDCRDVSFAYHRFPYRLTGARGEVLLRDGVLRLPSLEALASRRRVRISAEITNPGPDFTGWFEISVRDPVPVDERLIDALPPKSQNVIRSLNPHGKITFWHRCERKERSERPRNRLEVGLLDCFMNYKGFRYPIYGIKGTLHMTDDHWSFRDLQGSNDSGFIVCEGGWVPGEKGGRLWLDFTATDVPLEDELYNALDAKARNVWNGIRPRGTIDQLRIAIRHSNSDGLSVDVTALQHPPSQNVEGRSITVKPSWLPYQLDQLVGTVRFHDGHAVLQNIHAKHGQTDVELSGQVDFGENGYRARLSRLHVDRMLATHDLISALPSALGQAVAKLQLMGPVSMSGWLELAGSDRPSTPQSASWQLAFDLENGGIDCGVRLEHIHGQVTLSGRYAADDFFSTGTLQIDSLMYQGIQLTDVRGPLSIDRSRVAFGQWSSASRPQQLSPRPLLADAFAGSLAGSGEFWLADSRYELEATLRDADLSSISREMTSKEVEISGKTYATLRLHGMALGSHTLRGAGQVQLRQADIYDLPLMIRLLKLLRIQQPDETAFTSSDVKFRVEDDIIYFDRILFEGDAISLEGRGEMNLERTMNLTFDTSVGRDDGQLLSVLVRPFLKEAGRRLMLIRVTGPLEHPKIDRIPFPDVNQTIQQVFPPVGEAPPTGHVAVAQAQPVPGSSQSLRKTEVVMSVGPLGVTGSVAGSPVSQTRGSDSERAQQETAAEARAKQSQQKAESAAGVGETEQDQEASDRDADGRRLWEEPPQADQQVEGESSAAAETQSKDPSGNRGVNLDLSG